MGKKQASTPVIPLLKTVEQMSKISGIGENKLRELMDKGEIEYVQNGNRRLIAESVLAPGENRHFEPGENNQFQPGRNRQSVPGGCSQPRFECRF